MDAILDIINNNWVMFDENDMSSHDNFYVNRPDKILKYLTGKDFEVRKENADYVLKENEYAVEYWTVNGKVGHFARTYKDFNSLEHSNCVSKGKITSYRIFKEVQ